MCYLDCFQANASNDAACGRALSVYERDYPVCSAWQPRPRAAQPSGGVGLFMPQGIHGIQVCSSARRDVACYKRYADHQ
jgi:hypothetical protein